MNASALNKSLEKKIQLYGDCPIKVSFLLDAGRYQYPEAENILGIQYSQEYDASGTLSGTFLVVPIKELVVHD
jgi:hypothetical protein